jgi:hypothetical protein
MRMSAAAEMHSYCCPLSAADLLVLLSQEQQVLEAAPYPLMTFIIPSARRSWYKRRASSSVPCLEESVS